MSYNDGGIHSHQIQESDRDSGVGSDEEGADWALAHHTKVSKRGKCPFYRPTNKILPMKIKSLTSPVKYCYGTIKSSTFLSPSPNFNYYPTYLYGESKGRYWDSEKLLRSAFFF